MRVEDIVAESCTNLIQSGLARPHKLMGDNIRIDYRYVMFGEQVCDSAFAARDTTRQSNSKRTVHVNP